MDIYIHQIKEGIYVCHELAPYRAKNNMIIAVYIYISEDANFFLAGKKRTLKTNRTHLFIRFFFYWCIFFNTAFFPHCCLSIYSRTPQSVEKSLYIGFHWVKWFQKSKKMVQGHNVPGKIIFGYTVAITQKQKKILKEKYNAEEGQ